MNGRRAQAARNDEKILDAARETYLADPHAPISVVAATAGVGISALYRRYPSKEVLLQELARDGLHRFKSELKTALESKQDPWSTYTACLQRVLDGRSQALAQRLAGTFAPTVDLTKLANETGELYARLHRRTQDAGALRPDITAADVVLLLEMLSFTTIPGPSDGAPLRRRYLALITHSLHTTHDHPLPGPPAVDADLASRWQRGPTSENQRRI